MIRSHVANLPQSGFLSLAAERDWPVLIHSAVHPDDPWSQVQDILDVVEATPRVRFNVAHSLRFDRPGLDRLATLPNAWCDCSAHCIHCDLALEDDSPVVAPPARRFDADYRDPGQVLAALAEAYPQQMLWGSDAPYYSYVATFIQPDGTASKYDLRSSMERETSALYALSDDGVQRIAGTNAEAWLKGAAR
jgi:predicted TIM-barrel fold metal-dependent hydrolase